jgi:hypothetical protein
MDSVQWQEILAELIGARIALRPGCTGEAISVERELLELRAGQVAVCDRNVGLGPSMRRRGFAAFRPGRGAAS